MRYWKRSTVALTLSLSLFLAACGGSGFANQLRVILTLAPPLIDSLVASGAIPSGARSTYIKDFSDLADGAISLKENLDACKDKPCKLGAVDIYQQVFFDVQARGHLGNVEKLRKVQVIVAGIIASARIFYGGSNITRGATTAPAKSIDEQLDDLKREMQVSQVKIDSSTLEAYCRDQGSGSSLCPKFQPPCADTTDKSQDNGPTRPVNVDCRP